MQNDADAGGVTGRTDLGGCVTGSERRGRLFQSHLNMTLNYTCRNKKLYKVIKILIKVLNL